ncbi:DinB family protein [Zhouia sp. PK063]|uniref:DinB family protein n=1 Tax=Zhouia sp. PK063 TaxID=3373602 RepID=UPI00379412A5
MHDFFLELLDYHDKCNNDLFKAFSENQIPEHSNKLLNHLIITHHVWNHRMIGEPSNIAIWGEFSLEELRLMNAANMKLTKEILLEKPLTNIIDYKNSKGISYQAFVKDIIFHLLNHFTYHRAQIATNFRENGLVPLVSDYIYYKTLA